MDTRRDRRPHNSDENMTATVLTDEERNRLNIAISTIRESFMQRITPLDHVTDNHMLQTGLKIFIEPQVQTARFGRESVPLCEAMRFFLSDDPSRSLLILGDSGTGKTTLMHKLVQNLWNTVDEPQTAMPASASDTAAPSSHQASIISGPIPIYIPLNTYRHWINEPDFLERYLQSLSINNADIGLLKRSGRLVLFCDGFDEVNVTVNWFSRCIWTSFGLKLVTTCRPEVLKTEGPLETRSLLQGPGKPQDQLREWRIQPFDTSQIEVYIERYFNALLSDHNTSSSNLGVSSPVNAATQPESYQANVVKGKQTIDDEDSHSSDNPDLLTWQDYLVALESMPTVRALVRTPVLLYMVMRALPKLLAERSEDETSAKAFPSHKVYQVFIAEWFSEQRKRIGDRGDDLERRLSLPLVRYMAIYAENLAAKALAETEEGGALKIQFTDKETLDANLLVPRFPKFESGYQNKDYYEYFEYGKYEQALEELHGEFHYDLTPQQDRDMHEWEEIIQQRKENIALIRSGCLLRTDGDQLCVLHKSIVEYLTSEALYQCVEEVERVVVGLKVNVTNERESLEQADSHEIQLEPVTNAKGKSFVEKVNPFFEQYLREQPNVIRFLAEHANESSGFRGQLFQLIEYSKSYPHFGIAASNAATVLVCSGVSLSGLDWRHVDLCNADLRGAFLVNTQLQYANLSGAWFNNASLDNAQLQGANLVGAKWGKQLPSLIFKNALCCISYSAGGAWLAAGDNVGYVHIQDGHSHVRLCSLKNYGWGRIFRKNSIGCLAFSPKSNQTDESDCLAVGSQGGFIRIWKAHTWKRVSRLKGGDTSIISLAWRFDGNVIAASDAEAIRIWNKSDSGEWGFSVFQQLSHIDTVLFWQPGGEFLASGGEYPGISVWCESSAGIWRSSLLDHSYLNFGCVWHPNGRTLASGTKGGIFLWQQNDAGSWESSKLEGCVRSSKVSIAWHPGGECFATCDKNYVIRLWYQNKLGSWESLLFGRHSNPVNTLIWHPAGLRLASSDDSCTVRFWQHPDLFESHTIASESHTAPIRRLAWSSDGKFLICAAKYTYLRKFSNSWGCDLSVLRAEIRTRNSLFWRPKEKILTSICGYRNAMTLWNPSEGSDWIDSSIISSDLKIQCFAWHPEGKILAAGCESGNILLFNQDDEGDWQHSLIAHSIYDVISIGWFKSGERLIAITKLSVIFLWDYPEQKRARFSVYPESFITSARKLALHPNGEIFALPGYEAEIFFWQISLSELLPLRSLNGHRTTVTALAWQQDGEYLVSGSDDQTIRLWRSKAKGVWKTCLKILTGSEVTALAFRNKDELTVGCRDGHIMHLKLLERNGQFIYHLLYTTRTSNMLRVTGANISGAFFGDISSAEFNHNGKFVHQLLTENGAEGKPSDSPMWHRMSQVGLFKPPAEQQCRNVVQGTVRLSSTHAAVSVLSNRKNHSFMLIEYLSQIGHMVYRSEITTSDRRTAVVTHALWEDDRLFSKLRNRVKDWGCQTFKISLENCQVLMDAIHADQSLTIKYRVDGIRGHNCLTWCFEKLKKIGVDASSDNWLDAIIKSPKRHIPLPVPVEKNDDEGASSSYFPASSKTRKKVKIFTIGQG